MAQKPITEWSIGGLKLPSLMESLGVLEWQTYTNLDADPAVPHNAWKIPNGGMYALYFDDSLKCSKWSTAPRGLFTKRPRLRK